MVKQVWPRANAMEDWDSEDGHCWSLEPSTYTVAQILTLHPGDLLSDLSHVLVTAAACSEQ
jgi:hypothetical protein